jgi:isocitrate/isopropylmalate dehydrogenase
VRYDLAEWDRAVTALLGEGAVRTPDMGGTATTREVAKAVAARLG